MRLTPFPGLDSIYERDKDIRFASMERFTVVYGRMM
jgi:hypothetical protein